MFPTVCILLGVLSVSHGRAGGWLSALRSKVNPHATDIGYGMTALLTPTEAISPVDYHSPLNTQQGASAVRTRADVQLQPCRHSYPHGGLSCHASLSFDEGHLEASALLYREFPLSIT